MPSFKSIKDSVKEWLDPLPLNTKITITEGKYTGKNGVVKRYEGHGVYRVNVNNVGTRNFNRTFLKPRNE